MTFEEYLDVCNRCGYCQLKAYDDEEPVSIYKNNQRNIFTDILASYIKKYGIVSCYLSKDGTDRGEHIIFEQDSAPDEFFRRLALCKKRELKERKRKRFKMIKEL